MYTLAELAKKIQTVLGATADQLAKTTGFIKRQPGRVGNRFIVAHHQAQWIGGQINTCSPYLVAYKEAKEEYEKLKVSPNRTPDIIETRINF